MASSDRFELFAETREVIVEDLLRELAEPLRGIADDLEAAAGRWGVARDRQALLEAARSLRDGARGWLDTVGRAFGDRALRCLDVASRVVGTEVSEGADDDATRWRLLDESQLDAQILVGDLARLIRDAVGPAYPVYGGRIAWMTQHRWVDDYGQPLGARTVAHAVCAALRAAVLEPVPRSVLRGAILKRLPAPLAAVLIATNDRLKRLAVPALAPAATPPTGDGPAADTPADDAPPAGTPVAGTPVVTGPAVVPPAESEPAAGASAKGTTGAGPQGQALGQSALMATVHDVRSLDSSPLGRSASAGQLRVTPTLQPVVEIERDAVAFAHSTDTVPYSREARHALFGNIRDRIREAGATPAQVSVVDVVSAMFDYVIDDRRLPEASKPLVWRLHQPAIVLSLLDPGYLGDEPRSLRKLIEHFGAISTAFADEMGKGSELHRRLETVVRAVEIVASALQTRSAVMARQVEHEYSRASRSVTQLIERVVNERHALEAAPGRRNRRDYRRRPNREQEREVSERLRERMNERIAQYQVPDSVKDFLLNVWLRHLRTAALRDGEDSTEFKVAMEVVDSLLWSLDTDQARRYSRRELAERIPPLTRLLASGLRDIGARDDEYKPFFDELFLVHLRKMQPRSAQSAEYLAHPVRGEPAATDVPVLDDRVRVDSRIGAAPATTNGGAAVEPQAPPTSPVQVPAASPEPGKGEAADDCTDSVVPHGEAPAPPGHTQPAPTIPPMPTPGDVTQPMVASREAPRPTPASVAAPKSSQPPQVTVAPPTNDPIVVTAPVPVPIRRGTEPDEADRAAHKLREVLSSLDLADLPTLAATRPLPVEEALNAVRRGDWLKFTSTTGSGNASFAKVAWINQRRTIVLLVRHPDRKAVSIGMRELRARFEQGRVCLVEQQSASLPQRSR